MNHLLGGRCLLSVMTKRGGERGVNTLLSECVRERVLTRRWSTSQDDFNKIPGPKFWDFLIGENARKMDVYKPFKMYETWRALYGDLVSFNLLGLKFVISYDHSQWEKILRATGKYPAPLQLTPFLERERRKKVQNPNYEQMMIILTGEEWRQNRQILDQRFLVPHEVAKYDTKFDSIADDFVKIMKKKMDDKGKLPDLENLAYCYSTEGVGAVLYDMRIGILTEGYSQKGQSFLAILKEVFNVASSLNLSLPFYFYFPTPQWRHLLRSLDQLESRCLEFFEDAVKYHANTPDEKRIDMIHYMMKEKGQSYERALSNALTLFFAGADSTSNSVLWLLHNLGRFPRVQDKLRKEVHEVLGMPNDPRPFTASALRRMPYLRNVVKESLRLTPSGPGLVRVLDVPIEINGYVVPPKTMIFLNQYSVNKDPIQFPNPYELLPERWDKNSDLPKPSPWIHLPFGWGPRMCQGMRVSEMEMYALISKIVQNYEWISEGEAEPYLELFIRPEKNLNITWKSV